MTIYIYIPEYVYIYIRTYIYISKCSSFCDAKSLVGDSNPSYPLLNVDITMANLHLLWDKSIFLCPFAIAMLKYQMVHI